MRLRSPDLLARCLSFSFAAVVGLTGCEEANGNKPDTETDTSVADTADTVTSGAALVGVRARGARTVEASNPTPISLELEFDGALPDAAMVEVLFGLPDAQAIALPAAALLEVTPPASPTHRGVVSVSVRYGQDEVALEGGLFYGAALSELRLVKDGPGALALPGLEEVNEVYPVGGGLFLAVQHAPDLLPRSTVPQDEERYAAFRLEAGALTPLGEPLMRKRAKHMRTWAATAAPDSGLAKTSFAILLSAREEAGSDLTVLGLEGGVLKESATLATFAAGVEVLDAAELGGVVYALTAKDLGEGKAELALLNTKTGEVVSDFAALDVHSARLVDSGSITPGLATPIGGVAVVGWRLIGPDAEAVAVLHAATTPFWVPLHKVAPAPAVFSPIEAVASHYQPASREEPTLTTLTYTAREGRELHFGVVKPDAEGELGFSPVLKPSLIGLEQDGVHTTTYHLKSGGGTNSACRRQVCIGVRSLRTAAGGGVVSGGAHEMTLVFDGDEVEVDAIGLQSGAWIDTSRGEPVWVGPTLIDNSQIRDGEGKSKIAMVSEGVVHEISHDAGEALRFDSTGGVIAGANNVAGAARLRSGDDRVHVVLELTAPSIVEAKPRPGIFAIVLALNNTKKASPSFVVAEGESLELTDKLFVVGVDDTGGGEDDVVFVVEHIDKTGVRTPALLRVSAKVMKGLGADGKVVVGEQAGLTKLPRGMVVDQVAGHADTLFMLAGKSAEGLFEGRRYMGSLYEVSAKATAIVSATPTELQSAAKLAEESAEPSAAFAHIAFGDADPETPTPGLVVLTSSASRRVAPGVKLKELDAALERVTLPLDLPLHSGDLMVGDGSRFLLGFEEGDSQRPVAVTFTGAGVEVQPLALIPDEDDLDVADYLDLDNDNDGASSLSGRVITADFNGDGALDLLVASSASPLRHSYELLLLGQPGGGFTPIYGPDATIYGVAPVSQRLLRHSAMGPVMISKLKK